MAADQATDRTTIMASPRQCFDAAADFERYPQWATDVKQVRVLGRDEQGLATDVEFRVSAMARSTTCVLRYYYGSNPLRMAWRLQHGDAARRLDGSYEFLPAEGLPDATEVVYNIGVDLAVPLPGFLARRAEARIVSTALDDLKEYVEAAAIS